MSSDPNQILNPSGDQIVNPSFQIKNLYTKPSFGQDNNLQVLSQPPENMPQIYRGHRKKWGRTYINILHDPRVVRGNTYAAFVIPSSLQMEFLRMKEEEEKRKKLMRMPKKLPRVAYLGRNRKEEESTKEEEIVRPESPILKTLEYKEDVVDKPYFYEDRPPSPKFIPLPAGKDESTQIIDGELFDFDLEVKPVLEVLVGRSVLQARYELIEEYERDQYLKHKKDYDKKREFALNNLQRTEAKFVRKEEEKQRRHKQIEERKKNDIITQKKLMAKVFSKSNLKLLKSSCYKQLTEQGFLKKHETYIASNYLKGNYYPVTEKLNEACEFIDDDFFNKLNAEIDNDTFTSHKDSVTKEKNRVTEIRNKKIADKEAADEAERQRRQEQLERREQRRINRITESITTNIIKTGNNRKDVVMLPLLDMDELSIKSDGIHCLGGQLGEILFIISSFLNNNCNILGDEFLHDLDTKEFIKNFIEEFLLNGINDIGNDRLCLELKYLESPKYDFENIAEDKKEEFKNFIKDERRYISKSVHKLIELGTLSKELVNLFNEIVSEMYFKGTIEPKKVEPDPENQDPAYLEKIKKENEDNEKNAAEENAKTEKLKKKIKFTFIKPDVFKNKRENIGGFIVVQPNVNEKGKITEVDEIPIKVEEVKKENESGENLAQPEENKPENNEEKKDEEKKEEEKKVEVAQPPQNEQNANPNPPVEGGENKVEEPPKPQFEQVTTEVEYLSEVQTYKNTSMPIDTFVFHYGLSQWFQILVIRALRRTLKKKYDVNIPLVETFDKIKELYKETTDKVINDIKANEKYLGKSIIPIDISCYIEPEKPEGEENKEGEQQEQPAQGK